MPATDSAKKLGADPSLLLMLGSGSTIGPGLERAAAAYGIDQQRLRLQAASRWVSVLQRGEPERIAGAADALRAEGLRCAVVAEDETRSLPRLELAGGIAGDGTAVSLRVHGRPLGPPVDKPLLLVFGDLGREVGLPAPSTPRPGDTFRQRLLRAVFPVVDVVWDGGRIRVALREMAWRGLPGLTVSAPSNFLRLLELLVEQSRGAVLDFGFAGQDVPVEPGPSFEEPLEGADGQIKTLFDRYSSAAVLAWRQALYPEPPAGHLAVFAENDSPRRPLEVFRARPAAPSKSPVPWIRKGKAARIRGSVWPWIAAGPIALHVFGGKSPAGITALLLCGVAAVGHGMRTLRARERMRAVPMARIRSAAMGPVQLAGRVVPGAPLLAPYSRVRCGWYRFEVQERRRDGEGRESYKTILSGGSGDIPFRLDDGTGTMLVQPAGAEVDVPPVSTDIGVNERVLEWLLPEAAHVFVAGFARRRSTAAASNEIPDSDEVFVGAQPGVPFLISQHSREKETAALTRRFLVAALVGGAYVVAALLMLLERS